jgi:hypothetical protein
MKLLASLLITFSFLIIAQPVLAQNSNATTSSACDDLRQKFENSGGSGVLNTLPAYCSTAGLFTKIINLLYWAIGIVSVIVIIYAGYLYMTAQGNATQAAKARKVMIWAIAGLAIALLAAVIVNIVVLELLKSR